MAQPRAKGQGWGERESRQDPGVPYSGGAHAHTPAALSPLIRAMCMLSPAKGQLKNSDLSKALTSCFVFYWDLNRRKANFQAKSRAASPVGLTQPMCLSSDLPQPRPPPPPPSPLPSGLSHSA